MPAEALAYALEDDYEGFLKVRSEFLHNHVLSLTGAASAQEEDAELIDDVDDDTTD